MILTFLAKEWKFLLYFLLILTVLVTCYYEYRLHSLLPMVPVTTPADIVTEAKKLDITPAAIVQKFKEAEAKPLATWTSPTQQVSDKEAQVIAKADKANEVVKQTVVAPSGAITNDYIGMHLEKTVKIKLGFTEGGYRSVNVELDINKVSAIYHKSITPGIGDSVTVMETVAEF